MKDLICAVKKYIKSDKLRHLAVPQYEGLSTDDILAKIGDNPNFKLHMPIEREL